MSDRKRTKEEYLQRHADQYCNGDVEEAKEHAIVKATMECLEEDGNEYDKRIDQ